MKKVYGFKAANNGLLGVIPKQAVIVQEIYQQYLSVKSLGGIVSPQGDAISFSIQKSMVYFSKGYLYFA